MKWTETALPGVLLLETVRHVDVRGWFSESFQASEFDAVLRAAGQGPAPAFVQDNESCSDAGVLRGLHYQVPPSAQGRLVRVTRGAAYDVTVDLRRGSPAFGRWQGLTLDGHGGRQLWIPPGFAHGFLALEDATWLAYKATMPYAPACERTLRWDDPALGIVWPLPGGRPPTLSARDARASGLEGLEA